jgi:pimeloyl-ACP methyl ester carboxylesterase
VLCSLDLLLQAPRPVLTSQADYDRLVAYNRRLWQDCRRHTGPLINHVDTLSVVRDIDAIRAAVGDRKLSFYGVSYGTLMGQQYAEQFPDRVRALALDSNMDHSLGTVGFLGTEAWAAQDSFNEFVKGCRSDPGCALHDRNIRAFWADLLRRAARGELHDPFDPTYVVTQFDLIGLAFGSFYVPDWRGLADFLVALDTGVPPGDAAFRLRAGTATQQEQQLVENSFQAVFCADWHLPIRDYRQYATDLAVQRTIARDMRYSPLALSATEACLGWPGPVANPQHALRVRGKHQLLLINARHDPATGYVWALNAARQLGKHAVLATYDGWGHGVYGRTECVTAVVDRYLMARVLPARGSHCAAAPPVATLRQRQRGAVPVPVGPRPGIPGWETG